VVVMIALCVEVFSLVGLVHHDNGVIVNLHRPIIFYVVTRPPVSV
jgi:hypothetical protein